MGGVETHCEELLPRIAAKASDFEIEIYGRAPYMGNEEKEVGGVRVVPLPSPTGKSTEAFVSTLLAVLHARRRRADLVHIHAIGPALLVPLARLLGMPVILTHHGADYNRAKWNGFAKQMLKLGENLGVRFAKRIICVSPSLRDNLAQRVPKRADRLQFVPNGAATIPQPEKPDSEILNEMGLVQGNFLLAVARLVPEKGLDYLIDAHRNAPNAPPLVIAGAEQHQDGHADLLRRKADERVIFAGALPRDRLGVLYRNCGLFVMPSFHEGLPIAALEAMGSKAPILLSDIQPNLDLGLPSGNYFPVGDAAALAEAIDGPLNRFDTNATTANAQFDWDAIATRTAEIYREVAG